MTKICEYDQVYDNGEYYTVSMTENDDIDKPSPFSCGLASHILHI